LVDELTRQKEKMDGEESFKQKTGGHKMKKGNAVFSLLAGLIILAMILPLHAAAQSQQKSITFEQFMTLPKLETVTQAMGLKTLVQDYKSVREAAKNLMAKLCDSKKVVVESDLFYPTHFMTQFRCE
jgi:ribosomal protein L5